MILFFAGWIGCAPKKSAMVHNNIQTEEHNSAIKPDVQKEDMRLVDEAMVVLVPDSVSSVTLTECAQMRKPVRDGQVRFFDIPKAECQVRFTPSGLFTSLQGGIGVHHCRVLSNNSSVICTLCLDGLQNCLQASMNTPQ